MQPAQLGRDLGGSRESALQLYPPQKNAQRQWVPVQGWGRVRSTWEGGFRAEQ